MATTIFTVRDDDRFDPDQVLEFLSPFSHAAVSYLEHIIHRKGSKVSLTNPVCSWRGRYSATV